MGKLVMTQEENTEQKIVEAAIRVFQEKGFDGTRMRDIADTAKINKGLLHYYFKSKEKLFEKVFGIIFKQILLRLSSIADSDDALFDKIRRFTSSYIDVISRNTYIPRFVVNEINRNPDFIENIQIREIVPNLHKFISQVEAEVKAGIIRPIDPKQLIINMISMCIFPILAGPMIQVLMAMDKKEFNHFIETRKTDVAEFIIRSIQKT